MSDGLGYRALDADEITILLYRSGSEWGWRLIYLGRYTLVIGSAPDPVAAVQIAEAEIARIEREQT